MAAKLSVDTSVIFMLGDKLYEQSKAIVFLRECIQNAIDAHSTRIEVNVECDHENTTIMIQDNGEGIQDFEKYFLTIGGSSKRDIVGSIGGFGIAKLAIMAMEEWNIKSIGGMVSRDILIKGQEIDTFYKLDKGCIVTGQVKTTWGILQQLHDYLSLIETDVDIIFNGEKVKKINFTRLQLSNDLTVDKVNDKLTFVDRFIIRLNGLPMFYDPFYSSIDHERDNYIIDIYTDLTPYDEKYPLSANREELIETSARDEYYKIRAAISDLLSENAKLQKQIKSNLRIEDNLALGGTFTKKDIKKYSWYFYTFSRYIYQILDLVSSRESYTIGLSNDNSFEACYMPDNKAFMLNPIGLNHDKSLLLSLALHEVTHTFIQAHYEEFSTKHTEITSIVLSHIADKTFRW